MDEFGCPDFKEKIDPTHTAVIVVDVQNIFCSGELKPLTSGIVSPIEKFLVSARKYNVPVIFIKQDVTAFKKSPTAREIIVRNGKAQILKDNSMDEWAGELCIKPEKNDIISPKTAYSAFFNTSFEVTLNSMGIKTIIATGCATNVCVETTVRDAFMRGFYAIVVKDLTASYDAKQHESALENINTNFGEVRSSGEVLAVWES